MSNAFDAEVAERFLDALLVPDARGCPPFLHQVCQQKGQPSLGTVARWLAEHPGFRSRYEAVMQIRQELESHVLLEIADGADITNWQACKLQVETRKWLMSRMAPSRFGPKLEVQKKQKTDIKVQFSLVGGPDGTKILQPRPEADFLPQFSSVEEPEK